MRESDLYQVFKGCGDAVFAVDLDGAVRFWSEGAQQLFGAPAAVARTMPCSRLVQGSDSCGQAVCSSDCVVQELALHDRPVPAFDVHAPTASGERRWLNISIVRAVAEGRQVLLHLVRDVDEHRRMEALGHTVVEHVREFLGEEDAPASHQAPTRSPMVPLTAQERKVLELLSMGRSTPEIGTSLGIQEPTVRNHVQHVLHKMRVHTRLEAVVRAVREGLI